MMSWNVTAVLIPVTIDMFKVVASEAFGILDSSLLHIAVTRLSVIRYVVQISFVHLCQIHAFQVYHGVKILEGFSKLPQSFFSEQCISHIATDVSISFLGLF